MTATSGREEYRLRCVRCGGLVDSHGVSGNGTAYCDCACRWPVLDQGTPAEVRGCGQRIYFQVNQNENVQPYNLDDSYPHHRSCAAFLEMKRRERAAARRPPAQADMAVPGQKSLEAWR